jgi:ribonuclease J
MTAFIVKAVQDSGRPDFDRRICYFTPCETGIPAGWRQEAFLSDSSSPDEQRLFLLGDISPRKLPKKAVEFWANPAKTKELISCSPGNCKEFVFNLKCFAVDHSIPGATAWAVETNAGWIIYTGDLRLHGKKKEFTQKFLKNAARLKPKVLIIEGTRVDDERKINEEEVKGNLLKVVKRFKGKLVIADFGARNIERLETFLEIAEEVGRKLVITDKDAYLLDALHVLDPAIPDATNKHIYVYQKTTANKSPDIWKRNIYAKYSNKIVMAEDIRRNQEDFILCFSFFDINELPSLKPEPESAYIYSSSELYDEEQEIDFRRLHAWLEHFQIKGIGLPREIAYRKWEIPEDEKALHASGHAAGPELIEMVCLIKPQYVLPVHTERPEYFREHLRDTDIKVRIAEPGECINI